MRSLAHVLVLALSLAGCAGTQYYYQPAEQATATVSGYPAARYVIPPDTRLGDVRISSLGFDHLQLTEDTDAVPVLHIRLVVSNERGQQDWLIEPQNIVVEFAGTTRQLSPPLANADGPRLPVITVPRSESRTIDTYHPLPSDIENEGELPQFDVVWQVQTDNGRIIAERTPFERRQVEPPPSNLYMGYGGYGGYGGFGGWGAGAYPWGWYDPWYPRPMIIQRVTPRPRVYYYPR